MSDSRDQMIAALREVVIPVLRDMGFSGSFPHFRRVRESQIGSAHLPVQSVWGLVRRRGRILRPVFDLDRIHRRRQTTGFTTSQNVRVFTQTPQLSYFLCCAQRLSSSGRRMNLQCDETPNQAMQRTAACPYA